jgi:hypothetical protein
MTNKALADAEGKLTMLLLELRGTANHERAKLYVAKMTGGRTLAEYLHAEAVPIKERAALATTLIEILLKQDYTRLPELPATHTDSTRQAHRAPVVSVQTVDTPASGRGVEPTVEIPDDGSDDEDEADEIPLSRAEIERIVRAEVRSELASVLELVAKVLKETK